MTKAPINLQDLRRRLYVKAKAEPAWRFWGLYGHVCKRETLDEAYRLAKANNGAPGIDGVRFEDIEADGVEGSINSTGSCGSIPTGLCGHGWSGYPSRVAVHVSSRSRRFETGWSRAR